ncbi:hypothetical protein ACNKHV_27285 [Shigella flexneri]
MPTWIRRATGGDLYSGNVSAIVPERGLVVIQAQRRRLRNDESGRYGGG